MEQKLESNSLSLQRFDIPSTFASVRYVELDMKCVVPIPDEDYLEPLRQFCHFLTFFLF